MKDRIRRIMESQHMTQKVFAQFTGISEGSLSGVFNGHTRPTLQMVDLIHQHLPNISTDWLMYGQGPMYRDEVNSGENGESSGTTLSGDSATSSAGAPLLFSAEEVQVSGMAATGVRTVPKQVVKYVDKPARKITEIRVYYDDQTWESFSPSRS